MTEDDFAISVLQLAILSENETDNDLVNALITLTNAFESSAKETQKKRELTAKELIAYRQGQIALDMFINSAYVISAYGDNFLEIKRRIMSEIEKRKANETVLP